MADSLLSEDAFNSDQSQKLFEVIDELHSCGAKAYVDLPEIVIVGDQSAGKSSLLQSLTEIPFRVTGRLCTRFPTRIVSRRTPGGSDITRISIEASTSGFFPGAPDSEREQKYANFRPNGVNLSEDDFTTAVDDAMRLMGIVGDLTDADGTEGASKRPNFSSDVLRIELSGPNRSHFSILDVPGVFQSRTNNITLGEMAGVKNMVSAEMRREQSIVVCVANGTGDLATQGIFEMASKEDPRGERTVGVITKCDVTQHADLAVRLAQNDPDGDVYFQNGWFVVRNRTPQEAVDRIEPLERHTREENLFNTAPWNTLPPSRRGVQALKKHLGDLLCSRMKAAFPKMLSDIQDRKKITSTILESLGPARSTREQKRAYLTRIAQQFHSTTSSVLRGRYESIESDDLKLRKEVRDANDGFKRKIMAFGHRVPFMEIPVLQHLQPKDVHETPKLTASGLFSKPTTSAGTTGRSGSGGFFRKPLNVGPKLPKTTVGKAFVPRLVNEGTSGSSWAHLQNIACTSPFEGFSLEELRLNDYYLQGEANSDSSEAIFGAAYTSSATPDSKQDGSAFGSAPSIFGVPYPATSTPNPKHSGFLFDSVLNNGSASGFGSLGKATTSPFGTTLNGTSAFGATKNTRSTSSPLSSAPSGKPSTNLLSSLGSQSQPPKNSTNLFSSFGGSTNAATTPVQPSKATVAVLQPIDNSDQHHADIYCWIRDEIKANRGTELQGTLNPDVLPMLFHQQAGRWGGLAENHFLEIVRCTMYVLGGILESVGCDQITRNKIWPRIVEACDTAEKEKTKQLHIRVRDITHRHLQTSNTAFQEKVAQARFLRFQAALERYRLSKQPKTSSPFEASDTAASENSDIQFTVDMRETAALFAELHMSNSRNLENEIHDTLKAYYEIARDDFVEYVTQHIVENFINSDDGPVLRFSPVYVAGLSDEDIEDMAMEDKRTAKQRVENEATLERLKHAERIALRYA